MRPKMRDSVILTNTDINILVGDLGCSFGEEIRHVRGTALGIDKGSVEALLDGDI